MQELVFFFTFDAIPVLAPAGVASLALQRMLAARYRHRGLFAIVAGACIWLALSMLLDLFAGGPPRTLLMLAALGALPAWGLILWSVAEFSKGAYTFRRRNRRRTFGSHGRAQHAKSLEEAAARVRAWDSGLGDSNIPDGPIFRSRSRASGRWRPEKPLPFVPPAPKPG